TWQLDIADNGCSVFGSCTSDFCLSSPGGGMEASTRLSIIVTKYAPRRGGRRLHGLLFACGDDRGRPWQPRFAIWGRLPRQIEHRGLDLLPRWLVCSCE